MKECMHRKEMIMFLNCGPLTVFLSLYGPHKGLNLTCLLYGLTVWCSCLIVNRSFAHFWLQQSFPRRNIYAHVPVIRLLYWAKWNLNCIENKTKTNAFWFSKLSESQKKRQKVVSKFSKKWKKSSLSAFAYFCELSHAFAHFSLRLPHLFNFTFITLN